MAKKAPSFFLVIPAFNEAERFPPFLRTLVDEFGGRSDVAFQLVDDGSKAAQREECEDAVREAGLPFLEPHALSKNGGKGAAVLQGWENGWGRGDDWYGFLDADGSITADEVARVIAAANDDDKTEAWFASRVKMLGRHIDRSLFRHLTGRAFATLVGTRIDPSIYDSQCGFKIVRRATLGKFRDRLAETGFAFDLDLLAGLNAVNARTVEIPIDWHDVAGTHVRFFRDTPRMLVATQRIRKRWAI